MDSFDSVEDAMHAGAEQELCTLAGVDSDEQITRWSMADMASTLLQMDYTQEQRIAILKAVAADTLADALCEASGWVEIFENVATAIGDDLGFGEGRAND